MLISPHFCGPNKKKHGSIRYPRSPHSGSNRPHRTAPGCRPNTTPPYCVRTKPPTGNSLRQRKTYCPTSNGNRPLRQIREKTTVRIGSRFCRSSTSSGHNTDRATAGTASVLCAVRTNPQPTCRKKHW